MVLFDTNGDKKLSIDELGNNESLQERVDSIRHNIYHDKDLVYTIKNQNSSTTVLESNLLEEFNLSINKGEYISSRLFEQDYKRTTEDGVLSKVKCFLTLLDTVEGGQVVLKIETGKHSFSLENKELSRLVDELTKIKNDDQQIEEFIKKKKIINSSIYPVEEILKKLLKTIRYNPPFYSYSTLVSTFKTKISNFLIECRKILNEKLLTLVQSKPALKFKIDQITNSTRGCSYNNMSDKLEFSFRDLEEPSDSSSEPQASKLIIPGYFLEENFEPSQKAYLILKYFESRALAIRDELEKDQPESDPEQKVKSALNLSDPQDSKFSSYFYKTKGEGVGLELMDHGAIVEKVQKSLNDLSGHVIAGSCRTRRAYNLASKAGNSSWFSSPKPNQRDAGQARLNQKYDDDLALTLKSTVRFITAKVGNILINPSSVLEDQLFFRRILEGYGKNLKNNCLFKTEFCNPESLEPEVSSGGVGSGDDGSGSAGSEKHLTPVTPVSNIEPTQLAILKKKQAEEQYQLFRSHIQFLYSLYSSDLPLSGGVTEKPIKFLKNFLIPYLVVNVGFKDNELWSDITEGNELTSRNSFSLEQKAFMLDWDLTEEQKNDGSDLVNKRGKMLGVDNQYIENMSSLKNLTGETYQGSKTRHIDDHLYVKPEIDEPINNYVGREVKAICVQKTVGGFKNSKKRLPRESQLIYSKKKQIPSKSLKKKKLLKKISKKHKSP